MVGLGLIALLAVGMAWFTPGRYAIELPAFADDSNARVMTPAGPQPLPGT